MREPPEACRHLADKLNPAALLSCSNGAHAPSRQQRTVAEPAAAHAHRTGHRCRRCRPAARRWRPRQPLHLDALPAAARGPAVGAGRCPRGSGHACQAHAAPLDGAAGCRGAPAGAVAAAASQLQAAASAANCAQREAAPCVKPLPAALPNPCRRPSCRASMVILWRRASSQARSASVAREVAGQRAARRQLPTTALHPQTAVPNASTLLQHRIGKVALPALAPFLPFRRNPTPKASRVCMPPLPSSRPPHPTHPTHHPTHPPTHHLRPWHARAAPAGGTSIIMLQALEKFDPWQTRRHWAADSFQGLPPPEQQASLLGPGWRAWRGGAGTAC